jgi:hypothetical protein
MAGLPKAVFVLVLALVIVPAMVIAGLGQEVQPESVELQDVLDMLDANPLIDPLDLADLKSDFEAAVTAGTLSPEQAMEMLELVDWAALDQADDLVDISAAIQTVLNDLSSGVPTDVDALTMLTQLLDGLGTHDGTLNALEKAGASEEILAQVSGLVADGVPPGILVRIVKQGLGDGLSMEDITAQLDLLAPFAAQEGEDVAWGQIANEITGKGQNKHKDQEQNVNIDGNEEPEQEENEHGSSNGKKDDNPGQGKGKDKS